MKPCLVVLDGPLQGSIFPVREAGCVIGRDTGADIRIDDPSISRRHCLVHRDKDDAVEVVDEGSRNGTFVNGMPVARHRLEHGDELRLGISLHLVFLSREPDAEPEDAGSTAGQAGPPSPVVVRSSPADLLNPKLGRSAPTAVTLGQIVPSLRALFQVTAEARGSRGLKELTRNLLQAVGDAIPVTEASLTFFDDAFGVEWRCVWTREADHTQEIAPPVELVREAIRDDVAILGNAPGRAARSGASQPAGEAETFLLAPVHVAEGSHAVLYAAARRATVAFSQEDLQFITAVAAIAGPGLDTAMRRELLAAGECRLIDECLAAHAMIGESPAMVAVYRFVEKAAWVGSNVLITGESGTGKELVARAIHDRGSRSGKPWIAVNCAALPEPLLESELFGHERGAFTGAVVRKHGKFEVASGGTLFLDEIADMSPSLQAKLLRALQEGEFDRVGGTRPVKVDVRVIAATNSDLSAAVQKGLFRRDLFFRLNVLPVRVPALRERREDIPLLAQYFVAHYSAVVGRRITGISRSALRSLMRHDWPGNVRELQNAIERAVALGATPEVLSEDLPEEIHCSAAHSSEEAEAGYHRAVREAKQAIVTDAISRAGGNQAEAARRLGLNPTYLSRLVKQLGLRKVSDGAR